MSRISKETATAIAYAYREVETARDLLAAALRAMVAAGRIDEVRS